MPHIIPSHALKDVLSYILMNFVFVWIFDVIFRFTIYPAGISLFKVDNENIRKMCEICSKSTIKTNFKYCLVCPLMTLNKYLIAIFQEHSTADSQIFVTNNFYIRNYLRNTFDSFFVIDADPFFKTWYWYWVGEKPLNPESD